MFPVQPEDFRFAQEFFRKQGLDFVRFTNGPKEFREIFMGCI